MFRLDNVSKEYAQGESRVSALSEASLTIKAGEFVAVVGPSGSGKSTMLTLLGGMLAPTSGRIWFEEQSLYDMNVSDRAKLRRLRMGFVFQTFNLVPYLTAQENVSVPMLLRGDSCTEQHRRAKELLEKVGLADRADHKPNQLSTGQQQRVALARTLANDPSVIFADEPTGNLDPETRDHVLSFFEWFHRSGKTIVMVTHDPHAAGKSTRQIKMSSGKVVECVPARPHQAA